MEDVIVSGELFLDLRKQRGFSAVRVRSDASYSTDIKHFLFLVFFSFLFFNKLTIKKG
jgi:hypothetical protein